MHTLFLLNPTAGKADCTRTLPQQIAAAAAGAGLPRRTTPFVLPPTQATPGAVPRCRPLPPRRQGWSCAIFTARVVTAPSTEALTGAHGFVRPPWAACP